MQMNRRQFTRALAGAACFPMLRPCQGAPQAQYKRANTDWLAKCRYGIGVHWTAQTVPRQGPPVPFQKAVDRFNLKAFTDAVAHAGADYALFTTTHALQMLPAPHPEIEKILPGRTCQRDLIGEMADGLAAKGIRLLLYYNHSCNHKQDAAWEKAVGYHDPKKDRLANNLMEIVGSMSERYKDKVKAWWFDSSYSLDARGPHNSVTTDMAGFQFPWETFTVAAKRGYSDRLVTYNAGVDKTFLYTSHQDYWAGETNDLKHPAKNRFLDNGLQWFGWTCLDARVWVHSKLDTEIPKSNYSDEALLDYVRTCNTNQAPMTFNVGVYQDGTFEPAAVEQLARLGKALKAGG